MTASLFHRPTPRRQRLFWSAVVLLVAASLRLWQLDRVPPGFHVDEAFHLLNAQTIAQGKAFPVFITGNYGNEPLFAYLSSITLTLVGPVTWAGRLTAAWAGLIGVAFTIRVGAEMFPRQGVGTLAGLMLATLYSHLHFSRYGSQPILTATAAAGTMAALWRGAPRAGSSTRTGSVWAYGLAGVCLGLGLVAALAFRLFPFIPLLSGLALLAARRKERRSLLGGGLLIGGAAILIYAPLGIFFSQHPAWFFDRFRQTTEATLGAGNPSQVLTTNTLTTIGGLFFKGDADWRYNLASRPALDAAQLLFFLIGLGLCLRRLRQPEAWALLAWLIIGLSPSALTEGAPQFGRITMVTPALALLAARGGRSAWTWAHSRAARGLIVAAIAFSIALTVRDYFGRWTNDPNTFAALNGDELAIALQLRAAPTGSTLYATPMQRDYYRDYRTIERIGLEEFGRLDRGYWSVEYLLGPEAYQRFGAFNGRECLVAPSLTTAPTTYAVLVEQSPDTLPALEAAFPSGTRAVSSLYPDRLRLETYQIPPGMTPRITAAVSRAADFGGIVRLTGYTLDTQESKPGGRIHLTVAWKVEQRTQSAYKVFIHLIGPPKADGSPVYAQRDAEPCLNSYPTWQWMPGEFVLDSAWLPLPDDIPPGSYTLQVGWYAISQTGERLPAFDESGRPLGEAVRLEQILVHTP